MAALGFAGVGESLGSLGSLGSGSRAQAVTSKVVSGNLDETIRLWASTYAFIEDERNARLEMPDPGAEIVWRRGIPAPAAYWRDLDLEGGGEEDALTSFRK